MSQGHTQQAVADKLGLTRGSVGNIESGVQAVSAESLWKLALFFGININSFFEATADNAMQVAEVQAKLVTAKFHIQKVVEALKD